MNVVIADVRQDHLDAASTELAGGDAVLALRLDVTDRAAYAAAAESKFGKLHLLVDNAGVAVVGPTEIATFANWDWVMGANVFVADPADPVAAAERVLGGKADIVFECVGVPGLIAQAVDQVRNRGTILLLGLCTRPDTINTFAMLSKEVRLVTSAFFTRQDYEDALEALSAGAAEPRLMVTDTIPLDASPATFEALKRRTHQCKVLIAP